MRQAPIERSLVICTYTQKGNNTRTELDDGHSPYRRRGLEPAKEMQGENGRGKKRGREKRHEEM